MSDCEPRGLLIRPIRNGTVIDHITPGEAINVIRILGITGTTSECLSIATNVNSKFSGTKDIVKIEKRELSKEEVDRIALIAPHATINIIREYQVIGKIGVEIPSVVSGVIRCPNPGCISNSNEPVKSRFALNNGKLRCLYCDARISTDIASHII